MIATVSFQVDPENDAEVEILTRALRDLAAARRAGMPAKAASAFADLARVYDTPVSDVLPHVAANAARRADRPRRAEPQTCPGCGKVCGSPQGLGAHRRFCPGPVTPADLHLVPAGVGPLPEDGYDEPYDGPHKADAVAERDEEEPELDAEHACTSSAKRRGGWLAWCRCGFVTDPGDSREEALDLLAEHIEGE